MHAMFELCACVFTAQYRLDTAVLLNLFCAALHKNHVTQQFSTSPTTGYGPRYVRFWSETVL
jgi:hypothetical protein